MNIIVAEDAKRLGQQAAADGARAVAQAVAEKGHANIILATGASQLQMLAALIKDERIEWTRVTGFHLDEYLDLPESHPASFRLYLKQRLVDQVPLAGFHYVNGEANNPAAECERLAVLIAAHPIDVAFVGIGENGHLAFNDPPADFETEQPFVVVELDDACRRQQHGEGWFDTLAEVPRKAISMSVKQILKSDRIICSVPDARKAPAVANTVEGLITPDVPASILQSHKNTTLYLDSKSARLLTAREMK